MRIKNSCLIALVATATGMLTSSIRAQIYTNVLVHDTWQDSTRTNPPPPQYAQNNGQVATGNDGLGDIQSAWFNTGASTMTASPGDLKTSMTADSSSTSWTTYFTPEGSEVNLANSNDQLRLTWVFTPTSVNSSNTSQNFRLALVDSPSSARVTNDSSVGSATYTGYAMFMNMGTKFNHSSPFQLMQRGAPATSSALLSASGSWSPMTNASGRNVTGYLSGSQYTYVMSITRNASGNFNITSTMSGDNIGNVGTLTDTVLNVAPNGGSYRFDTLEIRPSDSNTTASAFDTSLFEVDYISSVVPEPATIGLVLVGLLGALAIRRRS